ncbi:MAG TPA: hypothetical protein VIT41_14685 [Microlunatus sp.]
MSKTKRRHPKPVAKARRGDADPSAPTPTPARPRPTAPPRPAGQRLFDMPYSSQVPSPVRPDLGLASLVARAGHNAGYDIDLTLLDAADHRLIRTGLLLAHRVLDGRGEWYLGAPDWVPLLPKELIIPMGQAELPDDLAELVRPFRRGAPLSPVAALRCERREFALRDGEGQTVALLRDDKVTVRRNGLTTARYREVMLTPVGPGLDAAQAEWLGQCLGAAGGTEIERFPRLVRRLGAPATGPSDLPAPATLTDGTFGQFLTQVLGAGVRDLISGDLAMISGVTGAEDRLIESARILRSRLEGLRTVLGTDWVNDVVDDLDWLVAPVQVPPLSVSMASSRWPRVSTRSDDLAALGGPGSYVEVTAQQAAPDGYRARLRSLRYLSLLERLVAAARAPKTGADATQPAAEGVEALYAVATARFVRAADRLTVEGTPQTWATAWSAAQDLSRSAVIRSLVARERTAEDLERLGRAFGLLERAHLADQGAAGILERIDELTPAEAFEAGRQFERDRESSRTVRSEFVTRWPKTRRKLGRAGG